MGRLSAALPGRAAVRDNGHSRQVCWDGSSAASPGSTAIYTAGCSIESSSGGAMARLGPPRMVWETVLFLHDPVRVRGRAAPRRALRPPSGGRGLRTRPLRLGHLGRHLRPLDGHGHPPPENLPGNIRLHRKKIRIWAAIFAAGLLPDRSRGPGIDARSFQLTRSPWPAVTGRPTGKDVPHQAGASPVFLFSP